MVYKNDPSYLFDGVFMLRNGLDFTYKSLNFITVEVV